MPQFPHLESSWIYLAMCHQKLALKMTQDCYPGGQEYGCDMACSIFSDSAPVWALPVLPKWQIRMWYTRGKGWKRNVQYLGVLANWSLGVKMSCVFSTSPYTEVWFLFSFKWKPFSHSGIVLAPLLACLSSPTTAVFSRLLLCHCHAWASVRQSKDCSFLLLLHIASILFCQLKNFGGAQYGGIKPKCKQQGCTWGSHHSRQVQNGGLG